MDQTAVRLPDRSKTLWLELVGYNAIAAGILIFRDRPDVHVEYFTVGGAPPSPREPKRVIVFTDGQITVVFPPFVG
ncbi:hypothetical protein ACQJBY_038247 [Aegilops geniculata]